MTKPFAAAPEAKPERSRGRKEGTVERMIGIAALMLLKISFAAETVLDQQPNV